MYSHRSLCDQLPSHLCGQVYDTPDSHVTRDFKEGVGRLGDLRFRVVDTSGLEPDKPQRSIQVGWTGGGQTGGMGRWVGWE